MKKYRPVVIAVLFFLSLSAASAQGIVVTSAERGSLMIPAAQFSSVTPSKASDGTPQWVVSLTDRRSFTLAADAVVEAYDGTYDGGDLTPGTVPSLMSIHSSFSAWVSHLSCQRLPDMHVPRAAHQLIPSGNGFVAVGGHTTGFVPTATAECFDGTVWHTLPIASPHDDGYSVVLADGRILVGGGYSDSEGRGYTKTTDIYTPRTQSFTAGPKTILSRARAKAIAIGSSAYISGNWQYDLTGLPQTPPFDIFTGDAFTIAGAQDPRSRPYMLHAGKDAFIEFAPTDYYGQPLNYDDGKFKADYVNPAKQTMAYLNITIFNQWKPLELPADVRPTDCQSPTTDDAYILARHTNGEYGIIVLHISATGATSERYYIPTAFPLTSTPVSYRGGAFICEERSEVYFVGSSGSPDTGYTLYLVTFNYDVTKKSISIADAGPFPFDPATASWLLLTDGRLVMAGGHDGSDDSPVADVWLFTPPRLL